MKNIVCAVPDCQNTSEGNKTFWAAPKQDAIRNQWFEVLGVPKTLKSAYICEDHFQVDDKDQSDSDGEGSSTGNHSPPKKISPAIEDHDDNHQELLGCSPERTSVFSEDSNNSEGLVIKCEPEDEVHREDHRSRDSGETNDDSCDVAITSIRAMPPTLEEHDYIRRERIGCSPKRNLVYSEGPNISEGLIIKAEPEDGVYCEDPLEVTVKMEADSAVEGALNRPYLEILDQPESSYRFRYKRESTKPHGPLKGRSHIKRKPKSTYGPKVKLCNFDGVEAILRVWLFCGSEPSPHQLVSTLKLPTNEEVLVYEPHQVCVYKSKDHSVSFDKLNIFHVVCGDTDYQKKYYHKKYYATSNTFQPPHTLPPFDNAAIKEEIKRAEKDICCLFIEAFHKTENGYEKLCDVFSESIKNKKSPKTNDLKIIKQSHEEGSCRGNQQMLVFTEKIIKELEIEFFEEDEDGEVTWSSKASFKESDIHKQVAICFWTPPYKDLTITTPIPVFFRLVRNTDGAVSHNRTYLYLPATPSIPRLMANPSNTKKRKHPPSQLDQSTQTYNSNEGKPMKIAQVKKFIDFLNVPNSREQSTITIANGGNCDSIPTTLKSPRMESNFMEGEETNEKTSSPLLIAEKMKAVLQDVLEGETSLRGDTSNLIFGDVWTIISRIQSVLQRSPQLDVVGFLRRLDPHKEQLIQESDFLMALCSVYQKYLGISEAEMRKVAEYFRVPDGRILYEQFCKFLENDPPYNGAGERLTTGLEFTDYSESANHFLEATEMERYDFLMNKIAARVITDDISLKAHLTEYEMVKKNQNDHKKKSKGVGLGELGGQGTRHMVGTSSK